MKKNVVRILTAVLMLSMVFSSSVFAAEKTSAWDSFVGLITGSAKTTEDTQVGGVTYRTHIENEGWAQGWVQDGAMSGSSGKGLRLEGIEIKLQGTQFPEGLGITYRTHIQNEGWAQGWVEDGEMSGSEGKGLRLEGIEIKLTGDNAADYSVEYRTHIQNEGWAQGWVKDGEMSGSEGKGLRLEGIEIKINQVEADLTAYLAALDAVDEADYTPASWAAYQEVVEANAVTTEDTQSAVDAATEAIVAAQNELVEIGQVTSVFAINATTVEVTLSEALTEIDKADFAIEGLDVTNAAIKQTNNKVVVLTTAAQVGGQIYELSYQGVDTGLTFTGISAVLPTAIKIADGSNFAVVGQEFTVTATVTTADANKAGIPVTFNIDAPTGSINQDIVVERYTNADGVAEYKYTRYATNTDTVSVYPTGAAAVRDVRNIFWSAQPRLSVETTGTDVVANNSNKTYTVTVRDQTTGNVVSGAAVQVLFNENIGTINNTTASATDVSTGTTVTPFQRATGNATTLALTTNSQGKATFTVTGANTAATPIVYIDLGSVGRLDAQDIQLWASKVTFQGAQTEYTVLVTPDDEATIAQSANRGRVYTIDVKKPDGSAFAGGVVQVAFNEEIDSNIGTTTNAQFIWFDNDSTLRTTSSDGVVAGVTNAATVAPAGFPRQMVVSLNGQGKATFMIANNTPAQVATPIVWIDQDSTTATTNHVLESTEPFDLGGVTVTEGKAVASSLLEINRTTQAAGQDAVVTFKTLDQNGAEYLAATDGDVRVTYTINNTGSTALTVKRSATADNTVAGTWSVNGAANTAYGLNATLVTVNPGMSATLAVTQANPATNSNIVLTSAAGTTYTVAAHGLTVLTNKTLAAEAKTGSFVTAVNVDTIPGQVTGTIVAFSTTDMDYVGAGVGNEQSGRVIMSVDGQPDTYAFFTYTTGRTNVGIGTSVPDTFTVGNDSTFANNSAVTNDGFEKALSVGNKVRIDGARPTRTVANAISMYNLNATDDVTQISNTLPAGTNVTGALAILQGNAGTANVFATGSVAYGVPTLASTLAPASGTITATGAPLTPGTNVTVGTSVFTIAAPTTMNTLTAAINDLPNVDATLNAAGSVITITATTPGAAGNAIALTTTEATFTSSAATLTGGTDAATATVVTVDGTSFAFSTVGTPTTFTSQADLDAKINALPNVSSVIAAGNINITSTVAGVAGNAITLAKSGDGTTAVSAATLTGGIDVVATQTETGTFTVLTGATASGNLNVTVNGVSHTVAVTAGDTPVIVAGKITAKINADGGVAGYVVTNPVAPNNDKIVFTSVTANTPITPDITVTVAN